MRLRLVLLCFASLLLAQGRAQTSSTTTSTTPARAATRPGAKGPLPDPALLDGSTQPAEKHPDSGMLGQFEIPGDENAKGGKVGGQQNPNQQQGGGGGQQAQNQSQQGGGGGQMAGMPQGGGGGEKGRKVSLDGFGQVRQPRPGTPHTLNKIPGLPVQIARLERGEIFLSRELDRPRSPFNSAECDRGRSRSQPSRASAHPPSGARPMT